MKTRILALLLFMVLLLAGLLAACGDDDDDDKNDDDDDDAIDDDDDDVGCDVNVCMDAAEDASVPCLSDCQDTFDPFNDACRWKGCSFVCEKQKFDDWIHCLTDNDCEDFYGGEERDPLNFWACRMDCYDQYKPCYDGLPDQDSCTSCDTPYQACVELCRDTYYY